MDWWEQIGRSGVGASMAAVVAACASAVAVIITALRKRRDVDIEDLQKRVTNLTQRLDLIEEELDSTRSDLVEAEHDRFVLRRTLAQHGIPDPTMEAS